MESEQPHQFDISETAVEYFDKDELPCEPVRAVLKVTTDYDNQGTKIRKFVELNNTGFVLNK